MKLSRQKKKIFIFVEQPASNIELVLEETTYKAAAVRPLIPHENYPS